MTDYRPTESGFELKVRRYVFIPKNILKTREFKVTAQFQLLPPVEQK